MGRYYNGDIEGKFWFGVQSSDDADFFGVSGNEPNYLEYYFSKEDKLKVEEGITKCHKALGKYEEKLDAFFKKNKSYNNEMLMKEWNEKEKKVREMLEWYARLKLGKKIYQCLLKSGQCSFEAEL